MADSIPEENYTIPPPKKTISPSYVIPPKTYTSKAMLINTFQARPLHVYTHFSRIGNKNDKTLYLPQQIYVSEEHKALMLHPFLKVIFPFQTL